jgi:hypothetical protein
MLDNLHTSLTLSKQKFGNEISTDSQLGININKIQDFQEESHTLSCAYPIEYYEHLEDNTISHLLAHTIRSQDTEGFIFIYDQIPGHYTKSRVSLNVQHSMNFIKELIYIA